jgi:RNA polymerase sigma factor (sigma-70 family)
VRDKTKKTRGYFRASVPYQNHTIELMPKYEYTAEMHEQDTRIAKWFCHKKFCISSEKAVSRDDLVQWCIINLWKARPRYDKTKGKYISFASTVCLHTCQYYTIQRQIAMETETRELDEIVFLLDAGHEITRLDMVGENDNYDLDTEYLKKVLNKAVAQIKTAKRRSNTKAIIDLMLGGATQQEIADGLGVTRQYISFELAKIKKFGKVYLRKDGFIT